MDVMADREIELGMQKFDKQHDSRNPFAESDRQINSK